MSIVAGLLIQKAVPDPSKWLEIIKAVTDPFSLLALIVLVLGVLGYRALDGERRPWSRIVSLLIVVVALAALGLNATRIINVQTTGKAEAKTKDQLFATIVFRGSHRTVQPLKVPFQVGSGQVNFGCGDSAHPSVSYNAPSGARETNAVAEWVNTSNVKGQNQQAVIAGTVVTASGTITGLDRNWLGSCDGGGHGELILKGSYVIDQPTAPEPITKSVRSVLERSVAKMIDLPAEGELSTESCEITVSSERGQSGRIVLAIRKTEGRTVSEVISREGNVSAQIVDGRVSLRAE